ncbi:unnamed protein product [Ostreobium quekettii]|uniref:VHS domain-containing protein n=1 Tax=Ostreobium quekettii TaxID=121088 RepID=A0A8S1J0Q9_9CHLO|nr:unnamed protein product [Ostreobium quekettii]|eukprot:evm.model.scf_682EXC.3 EVM.evm.TU.scf_682EXC.3   scf_682EXC:14288-19250(+)
MNRLKETIFRNQKYQPNLQGQAFDNLCRQATAKTLKEPDAELHREIELAINDKESGPVEPQELVSVLRKRLRSDNPHKQYLAVHLTKHILAKCTTRVKAENIFAEILFEVAVVAASPSRPETPEAKIAKKAAFDVLRGNGKAGQAAFRAVTGLGYSQHWDPETRMYTSAPLSARSGGEPSKDAKSPRQTASPRKDGQASPGGRAETIKKLKHATQLAKSHTEVFQDMLMHTEPGLLENGLIEELLGELEGLKQETPALIQQLSGKEGPDTEVVLASALEALDGVNVAMTLYKAVKEGRTKEVQENKAATQEKQESFSFLDLSEPSVMPGGATAPASSAKPASTTPNVDPFGLGQLEDGLADAFADLAVQRAQEVANAFQPTAGASPEPTGNPFMGGTLPAFPTNPNPFAPAAPTTAPVRQLGRQISAPEARMQEYQGHASMPHVGQPMGMMNMGGSGSIMQSNPRALSRSATQTRAPSPTLSSLDPFAELAATPPRAVARGKPMMGMMGQPRPLAQGASNAMNGMPPCPSNQPLGMRMTPGPMLNTTIGGNGNVRGAMAGFGPPPQQSPGLNMAGGHQLGGGQWR